LQAQSHLAAIADELAPLAALRAEREALERLFAASTHRATLHAQLTEVRASLAELDQRLAALPTSAQVGSARADAEAKRAAASALAAQAEERRIVWVRDLQDAETKRQALRDQYRDLQEQLERITAAGQDGACPTCSRPLGKDFEAVLGVLSRQVEEVRFNGSFYKQRIDQLEKEPADLQGLDRDVAAAEAAATAAAAETTRLEAPLRDAGKLAARRASLSERIAELEATLAGAEGTYDPERHDEVKRQLAVLEPKALEAERYRAQADRAARLAPELLAAEKAVSEREDALAVLRRRREEVEFSENDVEQVRVELESSEAARRSAEIRVVEARGERSAAEEAGRAVARRKAERDARAEEVRGAERELLLAQELDRALTDLRTDLNASLRPDLSDLASGFLRELTKGRYTDLELDEDYTPALLEDGEVKPVISGGEEDVANLALRLAISQMIAERAGQPLSLLVLDEVFGSLDEERRGAVMDLLRGLADRFPQVILITHIEAVREGFDRLIRIDRDPARRISVMREDPLGGGGHDVAA
jgi:exonuclease SbcC